MPAWFIRLGVWLLVIGYACPHTSHVRAQQNTSPGPTFSSMKEFRDFVSLYFPPGTFRKLDGSPDDSRANVLALYLRGIAEPPLDRSDKNLEAHAYRLVWTAFPAGKTVVLRLQLDSQGTARIFAKQTPFDGTNLLLNNEKSISIEAVNRFLECVKRGDFWRLPTREQHEPQVKDGSYWVLEGVRDGNYHLVYRRNPESNPGAFTDIGRSLGKELAQLPDSIINIPPGEGSVPIRRAPIKTHEVSSQEYCLMSL